MGYLTCSDELYHHGIKGQKWGVRRFQYADGSYTTAGKKRYGFFSSDNKKSKEERKQIRSEKKAEKEAAKAIKKAEKIEQTKNKAVVSGDPKKVLKNIQNMSLAEIKEAESRINYATSIRNAAASVNANNGKKWTERFNALGSMADSVAKIAQASEKIKNAWDNINGEESAADKSKRLEFERTRAEQLRKERREDKLREDKERREDELQKRKEERDDELQKRKEEREDKLRELKENREDEKEKKKEEREAAEKASNKEKQDIIKEYNATNDPKRARELEATGYIDIEAANKKRAFFKSDNINIKDSDDSKTNSKSLNNPNNDSSGSSSANNDSSGSSSANNDFNDIIRELSSSEESISNKDFMPSFSKLISETHDYGESYLKGNDFSTISLPKKISSQSTYVKNDGSDVFYATKSRGSLFMKMFTGTKIPMSAIDYKNVSYNPSSGSYESTKTTASTSSFSSKLSEIAKSGSIFRDTDSYIPKSTYVTKLSEIAKSGSIFRDSNSASSEVVTSNYSTKLSDIAKSGSLFRNLD